MTQKPTCFPEWFHMFSDVSFYNSFFHSPSAIDLASYLTEIKPSDDNSKMQTEQKLSFSATIFTFPFYRDRWRKLSSS